MRRRAPLLALLLLAALTLATCAKTKHTGAPNEGPAAPVFDLAMPAQNASAEFTFEAEGTWDYYCNPHRSLGMVGTVVVSAAATRDSDTVAVARDADYNVAPSFKPDTVRIRPGGYVRWINRSTMTTHTVTRP